MVCGAVVFTVMLVFTTVVGPFPVADAGEQVTSVPAGALQVKAIAVVKLLDATMPTAVVPEPPGAEIVTSVGPDTPVNPGVTVKLD